MTPTRAEPRPLSTKNGTARMRRAEERAWAEALARGKESYNDFEHAFDEAIAQQIAKLIEAYGLAETLHFLSVYQHRVNALYDLSFLKEHGNIEVPCLRDEDTIKRIIEDIIRNTAVVENYIIHCDDAVLAGDLTGDFRVKVFDDLYATIPEWEASAVIAWIRADIEAERAYTFHCVDEVEQKVLDVLEAQYGADDSPFMDADEADKLRKLSPTEWRNIFDGEKPPDDQVERFFAH